MTALDLALTALGAVAVVAALLAVTTRRVVRAALWLLVTLGTVAVIYLVLGSVVVALVQLLIYAGAVVVLVLFALMLTRSPLARHADLDASTGRRVVAAVLGLAVTGLLGAALLLAAGDRQITPDLARGAARPVGTALFTAWVLPFELLSVLLLAALVAALVIARPAALTRPAVLNRRAAAAQAPDAKNAGDKVGA